MKLFKKQKAIHYVDKEYIAHNICRRLDISTACNSDIIQDELSKYKMYKRIKNKKAGPLFRLTLPVFTICFIILAICMPIRWIIYGDAGYDLDSGYGRFFKCWNDKLFS